MNRLFKVIMVVMFLVGGIACLQTNPKADLNYKNYPMLDDSTRIKMQTYLLSKVVPFDSLFYKVESLDSFFQLSYWCLVPPHVFHKSSNDQLFAMAPYLAYFARHYIYPDKLHSIVRVKQNYEPIGEPNALGKSIAVNIDMEAEKYASTNETINARASVLIAITDMPFKVKYGKDGQFKTIIFTSLDTSSFLNPQLHWKEFERCFAFLVYDFVIKASTEYSKIIIEYPGKHYEFKADRELLMEVFPGMFVNTDIIQ